MPAGFGEIINLNDFILFCNFAKLATSEFSFLRPQSVMLPLTLFLFLFSYSFSFRFIVEIYLCVFVIY